MFNINFADDWIWTTDLWCWKRPTLPLPLFVYFTIYFFYLLWNWAILGLFFLYFRISSQWTINKNSKCKSLAIALPNLPQPPLTKIIHLSMSKTIPLTRIQTRIVYSDVKSNCATITTKIIDLKRIQTRIVFSMIFTECCNRTHDLLLYTHYLDHDNSPFLVKSCDTFHSKFWPL